MDRLLIKYIDEKYLYINIGALYKLVQLHYDKEENEFRNQCHRIIKELRNLDREDMAQCMLALLNEVTTFAPQGEDI